MSKQSDSENIDTILAKVCNTPDSELPELPELKQLKHGVSCIITHATDFQKERVLLPFISFQ